VGHGKARRVHARGTVSIALTTGAAEVAFTAVLRAAEEVQQQGPLVPAAQRFQADLGPRSQQRKAADPQRRSVFGRGADGRPARTSYSRSGVRVSGQSGPGTRMEDPD
jgi:hypothetical protein